MSSEKRARRKRRAGARGGTILARFIAYQLASWAALAIVSRALWAFGPIVIAAVALYMTIPLLLFVRWRGWPFYPRAWFRVLVVRVLLYTQLVLPFAAGGAVIGLLIGLAFGRALLMGLALSCGVVGAAALVLFAGYLGSRRLVVRKVEARVPGLPLAFDGVRIAQISDLHVGPHTPRRFLSRVADAVKRASPDIIAVTGDVVDDRAEDVPWYAAAFAGLKAPLGVYVIPGNHDIYAGWDAVSRSLRQRTDATILVNDSRLVERRGALLAIVGTGDPAAGTHRIGIPNESAAPDVERALAQVPASTTVIAFAHNPALWPGLAERGVALTLSGHTHWGQFALPRLGWSLASPFLEHAMGAHRAGDSLLYINPGTGYWGIPFRIGAFPEITIVTLRSADEASLEIGKPLAA